MNLNINKMNSKKFYLVIGILGMIFMIFSRLLLMQGNAFIFAQSPIDFAHTFMLIGACMTLSFSFVFPKSIFNRIATPFLILGIIAHIGMCSIDFIFWSYGNDDTSREALFTHLISVPIIWNSFFTIGPAFLFVGLTTQVWYFIKTNSLLSIFTMLSSMAIGIGQMIWWNEILVLFGYMGFSIGLGNLGYIAIKSRID